MTSTDDLINDQPAPEPIEEPSVPVAKGRNRKRLPLVGAAAGIVALVAVPVIAVASSNSLDEADVLACEASIRSYQTIADAGREDMESVGAALVAGDIDNLGLYADRMADHEQAAADFDTSACDAVAPSFAPAVDAAAELFHYFSLGLYAADAGDWETAASFQDEVKAHAEEAERLGGDTADEFNHSLEVLDL